MTTVFLDAVFKPFFEIVHYTGQQLTIDWTNFLMDGFLQIIQRTGLVSVKTRFQIPLKKKITRWKIGRARGPRNVSETGTEVLGKRISNNGHWLVCRVRCGIMLSKPHIGTVPPPGRPTEYYPFKICQVPMGHPVHGFICILKCSSQIATGNSRTVLTPAWTSYKTNLILNIVFLFLLQCKYSGWRRSELSWFCMSLVSCTWINNILAHIWSIDKIWTEMLHSLSELKTCVMRKIQKRKI